MSLRRGHTNWPEYHQVILKHKTKSTVWKYYGLPGDEHGRIVTKDSCICMLCKSFISSKGGNTSNLRCHLKIHHPAEFYTLDNSPGVQENTKHHSASNEKNNGLQLVHSDPITSLLMFSTADTSSEDGGLISASNTTQDSTLSEDETSKSCTEAIAKFIAFELQPYRIVENAAFKEMVKTLNPQYCMPGEKYFSQNAIPSMYMEAAEKLKLMLPDNGISEEEHLSVTCDCWTSIVGHTYVALTVHFIKNWELISVCLSCQLFEENHTTEDLKEFLENKLLEWDINPSSIVCCTTGDVGTKLSNAVKLLNVQHLPCFAHSINIGVNNAIEVQQVKDAIGHLQYLQNFIACSWEMRKDLEEAEELLQCEPVSLTSACPSRWWLTLKLCQKFLHNQLPICNRLRSLPGKKYLIPEETDITALEMFSSVASVLQNVIENLPDENYVISSAVLPLLCQIKKKLKAESDDPILIETLQAKMVDSLERYQDESVLTLLRISTFIDPRFRLNFFDESARKEVLKTVVDEISQFQDTCDLPVAVVMSPPPNKKRKGLSALFEEEEDVCGTHDPKAKAEKEVNEYISMPKIGLDEDPLNWWKNYEINFPKLSKIAKKYLSIQGSCAPSERVFTTEGILNKQKCFLLQKNAEMQIFLSFNKKILDL